METDRIEGEEESQESDELLGSSSDENGRRGAAGQHDDDGDGSQRLQLARQLLPRTLVRCPADLNSLLRSRAQRSTQALPQTGTSPIDPKVG